MIAIQDVPLKTIEGADDTLGAHAGKVLLVVNVASKCGLTPQYEGLEALYSKYREQGFEVLGFPANEFGAQEPGTNAEIAGFCTTSFGVDFPMFEKIVVAGEGKHPLYAALTEAVPIATSFNAESMADRLRKYGREPNPAPEVVWNFEKFLIGRDGEVVGRFTPDTTPDQPELVAAIEKELFASE